MLWSSRRGAERPRRWIAHGEDPTKAASTSRPSHGEKTVVSTTATAMTAQRKAGTRTSRHGTSGEPARRRRDSWGGLPKITDASNSATSVMLRTPAQDHTTTAAIGTGHARPNQITDQYRPYALDTCTPA